MLARILIIMGILLLLNGYIALHIIHLLPAAGHSLCLVWAIMVVFVALQIVPFIERLFFREPKGKIGNPVLLWALNWLPYLSFGIFSCLFLYSLAMDVIGLGWKLFFAPSDTARFDSEMLIALAIVTLGTIAIGIKQAVSGPRVVKVNIPLDNLPKNFNGFKIVQISDLHIGSTIGNRYISNIIDIANGLKPDLIALTGDIIEGHVQDIKDDVGLLSNLQAQYGRYVITGNHEYYWDAFGWIKQFKKYGLHVLLNEHVAIKIGDEEIILGGVTDYSTISMPSEHAFNPAKALANTPPDAVKILLAHQPVSYTMAQEARADLMLSGHTHGGQYFPFSLLIRFFQKYYKGLNKYKNMWIYVNRGTGYWGPPLRTFVPSEITLITLIKN
jgi:predicted MPP superfamily phosphohydrolase